MNTLKINTGNKKFKTNDLWGIFFEDINHAADGGLYPEMIQNRAFEFCEVDNPEYTPLTAWEKRGEGEFCVIDTEPLNDKNTHSLFMKTDTKISAVNHGFNTGLSLVEGERYNYFLYAKSEETKDITISFEDKDGNVYYSDMISINNRWTKYEGNFISPKTDHSARAAITVKHGSVNITFVSLMPDKTFMGHGLRCDLANMLADLKPKFMRFPGGCLTHDGSMNKNDRNSLYRWTNTIGSIEERPPRRNNWGYNQTAGLGYYEYFVFCEDIGAKAIPVLAGAWNPHSHSGVPVEDLGEWIDETLALIEFANGDEDSKWGQVRANMGHPKPFGLEYIAIGNEEIADGFFERYPYFHKAIREKYPDIKIIGTAGPWSDGYDFEYGWSEARKWGTDIVDEHYYMHPEWFLTNIDRYSEYDRNAPKVFLGEYASWGNKYENALAEACYMTAIEENADVVSLACYAPLFANADYVNWQPDMIWYDNHRVYGTVNYYVQKMFMANQADEVVDSKLITDIDNEPIKKRKIAGKMGVSTHRSRVEIYDVKINGVLQTEAKLDSTWQNDNGVFTQTDGNVVCSCIFFPDTMDGAKLELKAKKLSGQEGFRIIFGAENRQSYYFWEIGGWNNDVSSVSTMNGEKSACVTVGGRITVEENKEYNIAIVAEDNHFKCILDGEVYHDFTEPEGYIKPLYHTAGVMDDTTIIKSANYRDEDFETIIELDREARGIEIIELISDDMTAENNFKNPQKIVPITRFEKVDGNSFTYTFRKKSVSVLKIK